MRLGKFKAGKGPRETQDYFSDNEMQQALQASQAHQAPSNAATAPDLDTDYERTLKESAKEHRAAVKARQKLLKNEAAREEGFIKKSAEEHAASHKQRKQLLKSQAAQEEAFIKESERAAGEYGMAVREREERERDKEEEVLKESERVAVEHEMRMRERREREEDGFRGELERAKVENEKEWSEGRGGR